MRIRWIIIAGAGLAILAMCLFAFFDDSIYKRNFGDYRVTIWISADDAGSDQQKIHGSYYQRGLVLMFGYNSVELPSEFETPSFTTVLDEPNHLICIYDNNNYGFLMIVDQSDHDWYIGGMSGGVKISGLKKWKQHFTTLLKTNPEIPYGDYFDTKTENAG